MAVSDPLWTAPQDGGNAFPAMYPNAHNTGMSLRQYAAITLRVPNSGTDWLDAMIRESLRGELAAKAMQGFLTGLMADGTACTKKDVPAVADSAYMMADAMLTARKEAADGNRD